MKYAYVLEHAISKYAVTVGIFTSLPKALKFLKTLPKEYPYTIYKLPMNTQLTEGSELKDQQGYFEHWHYGTHETQFIEVAVNENDEEGDDVKLLDEGIKTEVSWPE